MTKYRVYTSGQGALTIYQKNNLALCYILDVLNCGGKWFLYQGRDKQGHAKRISEKNYAQFIHRDDDFVAELISDGFLQA